MASNEKFVAQMETYEEVGQSLNNGLEDSVDEVKFEEHRTAVIEKISEMSSNDKNEGGERVDVISKSFDFSSDEMQSLRAESGVDNKLKANFDEIDALTESTVDQIQQIDKKEVREFSKKYSSLARGVLAGQLKRMRSELVQNRHNEEETIQSEVLEKSQGLRDLEQEYSDFEQQFSKKKSSFVNRLFRRSELSVLEQDLESKRATLDQVKADILERQGLLVESNRLAEADNDRAEVRSELDKFYNNQSGLKEQFEGEQKARSVEEISKREGVFFIHSMPLVGEVQTGSEYNNAVIDGRSVDIKTKLELILGLSPTLSCSTIKSGDSASQMTQKAGIILGKGQVLFAKGSDAYTVVEDSPMMRRSKDATADYNPLNTDIQQNPEENIKEAIDHKVGGKKVDASSYNELVVENPQCAGFFFDEESYSGDPVKIQELQKLAGEFGVPLYVWKDGSMKIFDSADSGVDQDAQVVDLISNAPEFSPELRSSWLENAIANKPFKINSEVQSMYLAYQDGQLAYDVMRGKSSESVSSKKSFLTKHLLVNSKFVEAEKLEDCHVEVEIKSPEEYLKKVEEHLKGLKKRGEEISLDLSKTGLDYSGVRLLTEERRTVSEQMESIYAQIYGISETAKKNGDSSISDVLDTWLNDQSCLDRLRQFGSERIDDNGQLRFIEDKDVPKEVRDRILDLKR